MHQVSPAKQHTWVGSGGQCPTPLTSSGPLALTTGDYQPIQIKGRCCSPWMGFSHIPGAALTITLPMGAGPAINHRAPSLGPLSGCHWSHLIPRPQRRTSWLVRPASATPGSAVITTSGQKPFSANTRHFLISPRPPSPPRLWGGAFSALTPTTKHHHATLLFTPRAFCSV